MASAPIKISNEQTPDLQITYELKPSKSPVTDVTPVAQLMMSKTSPPAPLTPSVALSGKRKRLKPTRFDFASFKSKKKKNQRLISKHKAEHDPSRTSLSLVKEIGTKVSKAPVQPSETMIRAREIQATLGNEYPSFMKSMLKSHVVSCFWMGLPLPFCRSYLPKVDSLMVIEDENGGQSNVKYIAYRFGLSGGWRSFAIEHKLLEGDVLIFQLVESTKFKVYIVRAKSNDAKEIDDAVKVISQDAPVEHVTPAIVKTHSKSRGRKDSSSGPVPLTKVKRKYKGSAVSSQVQGCLPEPNISLKVVKTFKDFHIIVKKQCIDSELSKEIRMSYYNLCVGKNEILHDGVREGLYNKLVAGVIGETVNIANMLRNCKLTTTKEEFDAWDSSLESFELIGMKVRFLRDRIRALTNLAFESEDAKRYVEAKEEHNRNANEIKILEARLVELYESNRKIGGVVDGLKEKVEGYEIEFQKKVDAPW
ncbi:B3 domain-containing protein Os01g0234100-like [Bidens hawaiensis]|uniref:B3 domain-containing protein Os01g0234100-like n=1 Tax=Bidens hawaiensis TaxID=980011 RepID=UPI00404AC240